ncbi:MAG: IS21-like element helper ATPase IstB [Nevskia sp.]|nr:IS21-like element helper ATPase IstB [Nevskia sp.]
MLNQHTVRTLQALKLHGMAQAFDEQRAQSALSDLSFEERFGLIVDREVTHRDSHRLQRLLKNARLKHVACLEDIDYRASRDLDKSLIASLAPCDWIRAKQNLIVTGATGCGKTYLACALGHQACRQGLSVLYVRAPRIFEELRIAHGDGSFSRRLIQLAKTDLLLIDDWALAPLTAGDRNDLLEILDDRINSRSTLITSQLPDKHWHEYLDDPTLADAILDDSA